MMGILEEIKQELRILIDEVQDMNARLEKLEAQKEIILKLEYPTYKWDPVWNTATDYGVGKWNETHVQKPSTDDCNVGHTTD